MLGLFIFVHHCSSPKLVFEKGQRQELLTNTRCYNKLLIYLSCGCSTGRHCTYQESLLYVSMVWLRNTQRYYQLSVCLPGPNESVSGGGGGLTGACVLFASNSQSVGVWGPTTEVSPGPWFPLRPGEANMMSGSLSQESTKRLVSTRFSSARPDSCDCGVWNVTVSIGNSSWEEEKEFISDRLEVWAVQNSDFKKKMSFPSSLQSLILYKISKHDHSISLWFPIFELSSRNFFSKVCSVMSINTSLNSKIF